jgi:hypothetical protein
MTCDTPAPMSQHHREAARFRFDPIEPNPTGALAVSISRHRSASE